MSELLPRVDFRLLPLKAENKENFDDKLTFEKKNLLIYEDVLVIVEPPTRGNEMDKTLEENAEYMDKEVENENEA